MQTALNIATTAFLLFMAACATREMASQNDWLANAPEYSQASGSAASTLSDVSTTGHVHSGHR